ncbi:MAG: hypothetical protein V4733_05645 [Verrucomicrobiota bacterium]
MKIGILVLLGCVVVLSGCDKIRQLRKDGKPGAGTVKENVVDPALEKLVDHSADGHRFRTDIRFPANLDVEIVETSSGNLTGGARTAFGSGSGRVQQEKKTMMRIERVGDHVRYSIRDEGMVAAAPASPAKPSAAELARKPVSKEPAAAPPPAPAEKPVSLVFRKKSDTWRADPASDFRSQSLANDLAPRFGDLLLEQAGAPRKLWFSSRRFKPGDAITLSGDSLQILGPEYDKGNVTLEFAGAEPVAGHPCGVFRIKGDVRELQEGGESGDLTIENGRIWCSLLYPVILREELMCIITVRANGADAGRVSGTVQRNAVRTWKPGAVAE